MAPRTPAPADRHGVYAAPMPNFADLLDAAERSGGHRPLVTFHDLSTGERTELGVATAANWVRKTGNLLVEEFGAGPGGLVGVRPFRHWAAPLLALATWAVGAGVTTHEQAVVWFAAEDEAAACAGRPLVVVGRELGGRCAGDPSGVGATFGFAEEVLAFPDLLDAPDADPAAWAVRVDEATLRHEELLAAAAEPLGRVLLDAPPFGRDWCVAVARALATGGSLVLLRGGDRAARDRAAGQERVTDTRP